MRARQRPRRSRASRRRSPSQVSSRPLTRRPRSARIRRPLPRSAGERCEAHGSPLSFANRPATPTSPLRSGGEVDRGVPHLVRVRGRQPPPTCGVSPSPNRHDRTSVRPDQSLNPSPASAFPHIPIHTAFHHLARSTAVPRLLPLAVALIAAASVGGQPPPKPPVANDPPKKRPLTYADQDIWSSLSGTP